MANTNNILRNFRYGDKVIWIIYLLLCAISVVTLFSASSTLAYGSQEYTAPIIRHTLFIIGGIIVAGFVYFIPQQIIRIVGYLGLIVSIILLFGLLLYGARHHGAARWINLGLFQFQPSEIAKISLLVVVADLLSRIKEKEDEKKYFLIILGLTALVCGLIMIDNLSTAILLAGTVFLMMFLAQINWKYLVGIILIIGVVGFSGFKIAQKMVDNHYQFSGAFRRVPTWVGRIESAQEANNDPEAKFERDREGNYQAYYSQLAIARGGKSPLGVLPGNSVERDYLPQAFADYIYAIIVEESGIIGAVFVIILYFLILFRGGMLAYKTESSYTAYLATGLAMLLTFQAIISMIVVVGIITTGQPLPIISRGGTSAIITSVYFGILLGISRVQNGKQIAAEQVRQESEENIPIVDIDEVE